MLSREYLIKLGECCGEGCLMCPYEPDNKEGPTRLDLLNPISIPYFIKRNED